MKRTTWKVAVAAGVLWLAFCGGGLAVHHACKEAPKNHLGWVDVAGYDSEGYVKHFTSPFDVMEINHRHPLMAAVALPVSTVGLTVAFRAGREIGFQAVICCFALIGSLTCLMLGLVMGKSGASRSSLIAALALWLSFSHVWLLAGLAESFGISQAILLGVLLMVLYEVRSARAWIAASLLAGAVTVTNFIKPLAAWIVAADGRNTLRQLPGRAVARFLAGTCAALILCGAAVACKWMFLDGQSIGTGLAITWNEISRFQHADMSVVRRLWFIWNSFWCEPMMLHGTVIGKSVVHDSYATIGPHVVGACVLVLCLWSVVLNFRRPVVRAALAMVTFDILLHVLFGWGIEEGQIYCGHWFWIIPLLLALLPSRLAPLTATLALIIAGHNVLLLWRFS